MLTATFIHAPRVGQATERGLWEQGVTSWELFVERGQSVKLSPSVREGLTQTVEDSLQALSENRVDYFARNLASREHWRAASSFPNLGFLDIETDGGMGRDAITVIGLYDGFEMHVYLGDRNLAQFAFECQDYDGFVTFFGAGFDLPMLRRRFPVLENVFKDRLHIDLCPLLRGLGYRGGLKSIERQLKINRRPETDGLDGMDAVRLWSAYKRGGPQAEEALRLLIAYNEEDVLNMKLLLNFAIPRLKTATGFPGVQP